MRIGKVDGVIVKSEFLEPLTEMIAHQLFMRFWILIRASESSDA